MNHGASRLLLITGGARSGKSRYAEDMLSRHCGPAVTFVASLEPGDAEMTARIARHRRHRPAAWATVVATDDPAAAVAAAPPLHGVLLDCLAGVVGNRVLRESLDAPDEDAVVADVVTMVDQLVAAARRRARPTVVVSNEVGSGVVPAYASGRVFRDALGLANQALARHADGVVLVVAGLPQWLKGDPPIG